MNDSIDDMASSKKGGKTEDVYLNAFKQFDKNGDGYISLREMREVLTAANSKLTDAQIYVSKKTRTRTHTHDVSLGHVLTNTKGQQYKGRLLLI